VSPVVSQMRKAVIWGKMKLFSRQFDKYN
jgi:hypothetical protein